MVAISFFDLFKVGIGPSSSHTVGPMRAAKRFLRSLSEHQSEYAKAKRLRVELYGSLALTGLGHGTDKALILGLLGYEPDQVEPESIDGLVKGLQERRQLALGPDKQVHFDPKQDISWHRRKALRLHPNGMTFHAISEDGASVYERTYFSIGGGFVVNEETAEQDQLKMDQRQLPYPFKSAAELLTICKSEQKSIAQIQFENECSWRDAASLTKGIGEIWQAMCDCVHRGCRTEGVLPGGLRVVRRAPGLFRELTDKPERQLRDPLTILDWVNLYALAVNEENAAGSRVVTAPTNGAAGIIPAVGKYYEEFVPGSCSEGIQNYLLTAAAIGILYAENASISGAEVGCQGEVGVACSMAAGGLAAALGGSPLQVEQAAEIGMEHNLGLTCDPIAGLVQIPCIERNAMGSIKAINAARIALKSDGVHHVSLDSVIKTMKATGADMKTKYKETSRGGLAVNVTEC